MYEGFLLVLKIPTVQSLSLSLFLLLVAADTTVCTQVATRNSLYQVVAEDYLDDQENEGLYKPAHSHNSPVNLNFVRFIEEVPEVGCDRESKKHTVVHVVRLLYVHLHVHELVPSQLARVTEVLLLDFDPLIVLF